MKPLMFVLFSIIVINLFSQSINVDYLNQKQTIKMMGGDMERSQSFLQKAANSQEISDWCFKDIPLNACRVSYDKKQEMVEGVKNFAFYNDAIKSMKMVKQSNPDILFYATMKSDYNGYNNENNLPDWICDNRPTTFFYVDKYAVFLADYLELMHRNDVPIHYIAVSKEWTQVINANRTVDIIKALKPILVSRGVPVPLFVDPGTWAVNQGVTFINSIMEMNEQSLFHAFTTHEYNNSASHYPDFVWASKKAGAYAWNPETGIGAGGRTYGVEPEDISALIDAYNSKAFMYQSGIEGELFFEIFSRGVNAETRSIYFTSGSNGSRMKSYYVMKLFAAHVLNRKYVPASVAAMPDVKTITFVDDNELVIWVINNSYNNYNTQVVIKNVSISGPATRVWFDVETPIQGTGEMIEAVSAGSYNVSVKGKSISFIKVELNPAAESDIFNVESTEIDYGFVALTDTFLESEIIINAKNMASKLQLSITGVSASFFEIVNETTIPKTPLLWNHRVKIKFKPQHSGYYQAVLNIESATISKQVILTGEAYEHQSIQLPFVEKFPGLTVNSGPITNSVLNSFSQYKGWEIRRGFASETDRINITSMVSEEGYIKSPDIDFEGAFELKFFARMLLNDIGATTTEKVQNNILRNIFAVIGNDTIYDHKKAGNTLYQNFNEWTCTYIFDSTEQIKFVPQVSDQGVWVGKTDGLSFGPKGVSVRVQPTTQPVVNIAYGKKINFGEIQYGQSAEFSFPLKGYNLNSPLNLNVVGSSHVRLSQSQFIPDAQKQVDESVMVTINSQGLSPGVYTQLLTLTGESPTIRTRHLWITYEVLQSNDLLTHQIDNILVYSFDGNVVIVSNEPENVEIFSIAGVLQYRNIICGEVDIPLKNGVYIINASNKVYKVIVN